MRGRLRASSLFDRPTWGDCRQCPQTAVVQRAGVSKSYLASVANRSVTCPTRLETRTKESNMCASHWARTKPRGVMKVRSEEHTSELQSLAYLVCRLLLEKKKEKDR